MLSHLVAAFIAARISGVSQFRHVCHSKFGCAFFRACGVSFGALVPFIKNVVAIRWHGCLRRMSPARKRLMRDFESLRQDPPAGISGAPQDSNIMLWNAVIFGPDDSPWDGGTFKLSLQFSEEYPNKPTDVPSKYLCRWEGLLGHPAKPVDPSLNDSLLWFSQSLLCDPNTNSYANSEAALMYSENKREYNRRVRDVVEQSWD
ncbi:hypothetical protein YC2023_100874 [Brassica napus]